MRTLIFGLLGTLTLAPARADDKAVDAAAVAVVKKAVDAYGGADLLNKYKAGSMKLKGEIVLDGMTLPVTAEMSFALPDKMKQTLVIEAMGQKLNIVQVVNGKKVSNVVAGNKVDLSEKQAEEMRAGMSEQEIGYITPLLDPAKYALKSAADVDVDGTAAAVVVATSKRLGDKEFTIAFDKKTSMILTIKKAGLAANDTSVEELTTFSDYKKIDGIPIPHKLVVTQDGKKFLTATASDIKNEEKFDEKEFTIDD